MAVKQGHSPGIPAAGPESSTPERLCPRPLQSPHTAAPSPSALRSHPALRGTLPSHSLSPCPPCRARSPAISLLFPSSSVSQEPRPSPSPAASRPNPRSPKEAFPFSGPRLVGANPSVPLTHLPEHTERTHRTNTSRQQDPNALAPNRVLSGVPVSRQSPANTSDWLSPPRRAPGSPPLPPSPSQLEVPQPIREPQVSGPT